MGRGVCNLSTQRGKRRNVRFRAYSGLRTARLKDLPWKSKLRFEENGKRSERTEHPEMDRGSWVGAWSEGRRPGGSVGLIDRGGVHTWHTAERRRLKRSKALSKAHVNVLMPRGETEKVGINES